jgi:acyl-CoA dehydrogenase
VINGRKWWTSGAGDPRCRILIFMGKSDPAAPKHLQQSMILVPRDAPGVRVVGTCRCSATTTRRMATWKSISRTSVCRRQPAAGEGRGFEIAQGRLGPAASTTACASSASGARAGEDVPADEGAHRVRPPIAEQTVTLQRIADARIMIDQARLLTLKAAWMMDTVGNKVARAEIAMIKVAAPAMACQVIDWAIQAHGGAGICDDFGLARAYAHARALRLADGPDEVHRNQIGRLELARH